MSARAPLGRPSKNTGSVDAVCTKATSTGDVVSEVIIHAAATSFIQTQMLATSVTLHSKRKVGVRRGAQVESGLGAWGAGAAPGSSRMRPGGVGGRGAWWSGITVNCQPSCSFLPAIACGRWLPSHLAHARSSKVPSLATRQRPARAACWISPHPAKSWCACPSHWAN